ncbi:MAG: T9SS type A sorting domain-containing protein [Flavobacteriales bacterium]|nr:T9SS type A sorting domain-containing protein [Flavobacteriales bacterium]
MKRFLLSATLTALIGLSAISQTVPTYNQQVSCILFEHCTTCHHDGGIAPFSLMTYGDASAAAYGMLGSVTSRIMPPWPPNPDYNSLAHERLLTQEEIDIVANWVNGGFPEGTGTPPQAPYYGSSEVIQNPDLVVTMPQYTVSSQNNDVYRCFVLPTGLAQDVFITEIEVIPGNFEAVHHVLLFRDGTNVPAQLDAQDPGPGYTSFGGTGSNDSELIGGWVPGQSAKIYPANFGVRLPAGSNIIMQVHYPTTANGQSDQTKVNIRYSSNVTREVYINPPLNHATLNEGALIVPANQTRTFTCDYQVPNQFDVTILDVAPHMHLIGKSISAWATTPTNQTIPLIEIENWDFHWQGFYEFRQPIKIPAGSVLHSSATYDNTTNNLNNPNNPPQLVTAGEATTDEMMLIYFSYALYFPGDENMVVDTVTVHPSHVCEPLSVGQQELDMEHLTVYPNPTTDRLYLQLPVQEYEQISVTDIQGKTVLNFSSTDRNLDVSSLSDGIYMLQIASSGGIATRKFVIRR